MRTKNPFILNKLIFIGLITLILINSSSAGSCKLGCPSSSTKIGILNYAPGSIYSYGIDSTVTIYLSGNDKQETQVRIQGSANIFVGGNCDYAMKLNQLTITKPDGKVIAYTADELNKPVSFILSGDDELQSEICSDTDDNEYLLNVKRAIISSFQSAKNKNYETDIFGTCPTTSSMTNAGGVTIVSKVRNLNLCSHRETLVSGFITSITNENSGIHTSPLLNGDYSSEQRIRNGVLESSVTNEDYIFVPYTAGEAGTRAKIQTILRLTGTTAGQSPKIQKPTSNTILFESPTQSKISNINTVKNVLSNVIAAYTNNVGPKAAAQFSDLIRVMRVTTSADLRTLYQNIKSKSVSPNVALARKIYFDALFRTGTADSVEVCAILLKSGELNPEETKLVYLSLNLVQTMTKSALINVNKLLDGNPPNEAYLTVGNLVARYCRKYSYEGNEIKAVLSRFDLKLKTCKAENRQQEDLIVSVLKGLRNTENLMGTSIERVISCTNNDISTRIRVAAIQALTAAGYNQKIYNTLLSILKNYEEDSELRIESYLTLIANPVPELANEIKNIIDVEPIYQVGSFITSYLSALRNSVDPTKASLKRMLGEIRTTKKFPIDIRRYSFTHDYSHAIESLGLGGTLESRVIYSQKSFLPRSTTLNFTGEIFGNSFNLLELNARQEHLDKLFEKYFGPKGFFHSASEQEIYNKIVEIFNGKDSTTPKTQTQQQPRQQATQQRPRQKDNLKKSREKRHVKDDALAFAKSVDMGKDAGSDIDLDLSMKIFGSEMFFLSLGHLTLTNPEQFIKNFKSSFMKSLKDSSNYNKIYENHALLLDADLVYPTSIGFPIKLHAIGSSVIRVDLKSQFDLNKVLKGDLKSNSQAQFRFVPSANIYVSGTLSLDTYHVNAGLQVNGAIQSSTGFDVTLSMTNNGNNFDIDIKMPMKKQEIFSFDHNIVFISQEKDRETIETPLRFTSKVKDFVGCFDQLHPYIGVTFCGDASFTTPGNLNVAPFPLNGPNHFIVYLEVENEFKFNLVHTEEANKKSVLFGFDTPNSSTPRKTTLELTAEHGEKSYLQTKFVSVHKTAMAEIGVLDSKTELFLYGIASSGDDTYKGKIGFLKSSSGSKMIYKPEISLETPKRTEKNLMGYRAEGKIISEEIGGGNKYTFENIQLTGPGLPQFIVNGDITYKERTVTTNLQFKSNDKSGNLNGLFEYSTAPLSINLDLKLLTDINEAMNGRFNFVLQQTDKVYKKSFVLIYGTDLESQKNRIEFTESYELGETTQHSLKKYESAIIIGVVPAHFKFNLYTPVENKCKMNIDVLYSKYNGKLNYNFDRDMSGAYDFQFGAYLNEHGFDMTSKMVIAKDGKNEISNTLKGSCGLNAELKGSFNPKFTDDLQMDLVAKVLFKDNIFNAKLNGNPKQLTSNAKLVSNKKDVARYELKFIKAPQKLLTVEFLVTDILTGNMDFKISNNNNKGDGYTLVNLLKTNRKLKTNIKYNVESPNVDIQTDFFYDFEKDDSKKISFNTKSKIEATKFDSKNNLEVFNEKYTFNIEGTKTGEFNDGIVKGKCTLTLPTGRVLSSEMNREAHLKNMEQATGFIDLKLTDRLPNKQTRTVELNGKINKGDFQNRNFDFAHSLKYTDLENKFVSIETNVKNVPIANSHLKTATVGLTARGSLLSDVLQLNFNIDEYDKNHAKYKISGQYGNQYTTGINGEYVIGARSTPSTFHIQADINTPTGKVKTIKFDINGKVLESETTPGPYLYDIKTKSVIDSKEFIIDVYMDGSVNGGKFKSNIEIPDTTPFKTDFSYVCEEADNGVKKTKGNIKINYGQNKLIIGESTLVTIKDSEVSFTGELKTPFKNLQDVKYSFKTARLQEGHFITSGEITRDGKSYGWNTLLSSSNSDPEINIEIKCPEMTRRFYSSLKRLGPYKHKAELILLNIGQLHFDGRAEVNYDSFEKFYLTSDIDSTTLNLKKFHLEIHAKPGINSKGISFKATSDDKNILDGSTDFTIKEEKGKTIITGQGNVKFYDKQKMAKFDLVRTNFDGVKDGETGLLFTLNGNFGSKKVSSELKMTDRNFHAIYNECEDGQNCLNLELKTNLIKFNQGFNHELHIKIDLRPLGVTYVYGLDSDTKTTGVLVHHTFKTYLSENNTPKYKIELYIQPKNSGIVLTIPKRVIAVETNYVVPEEVLGKYDISLLFYPNKLTDPNNKAMITFIGNLEKSANNMVGKYDFTVKHQLIKPINIKANFEISPERRNINGNMELDIFKTPQQKILLNYIFNNNEQDHRNFNATTVITAQSRGLNLDFTYNSHMAFSYDKSEFSMAEAVSSSNDEFKFSYYAYASPKLLEFIVTGFNEELINAYAKYDVKNHVTESSAKIKFLSTTPVVMNGKLVGLTSMTFDLSRGKLLSVNGELSAGKEGRLEIIGLEKQLFKGKVQLDQDHFLASEYKVQDEEVKNFMKTFQSQLETDAKNAQDVLNERMKKTDTIIKDKISAAKMALPDFEKLKTNMDLEADNIYHEIMEDPTLMNIIETIKTLTSSFNETLMEILNVVYETYDKISAIVLEFYTNSYQVFSEKVLPSLKELYNQVEHVVYNIYSETVKLFKALFERIVKSLKTFEDDFNKITQSFGDLFKNFAEIFNKFLESIESELKGLVNIIKEYMKNLPEFDKIKEKYQEIMKTYHIPQQIDALVKETAGLIQHILPTQEVNTFIDNVVFYIEAKLTNKPIDDSEQMKKIYISFMGAIRSIIQLMSNYAQEIDNTSQTGMFLPMPISFDSLKNIPIAGSLKSSIYNHMRTEKPRTLREFLSQYRPYAFDLKNFLPPFDMHGHISDGGHYFTFDGHHFTFPGQCSYILSQDFINNNFSVIATMNNGKMNSISLIDETEFIEISNAGGIKLNGQQADLPLHYNNMHAWREYYSINVLTTYGAHIKCTLDLKTCHVTVSGYYLGKVRGLLGNGNGEPYDDFILPNNKLTQNYANFGNAYKATQQCKSVPYVDHSKHSHDKSSEQCNQFFSIDLPLRMCYYFIDPTPYREACEHTSHANGDNLPAICSIATTYASACRLENIPVSIPTKCVKCLNNKEIGETYTVKSPQNQADIVLVVDTSNPAILTEFTQNLMTDLRQQLKQRDLTDNKIIIIGYNKNQKYISLFTDKGKLDFNSKLSTIKLNGPEIEKPLITGNENFDNVLRKIHERRQCLGEELDQSVDAKAFQHAFKYPFRSTAAKTIIAIRGDSLKYSTNPAKLLSAFGTKIQVEKQGIALHLITPVTFTVTPQKNIKLQPKDIVGFNNKVVLTVADNKKKVLPDFRKNLKFEDDLGIELVENSNGYVFSLTNYFDKPQNARKPFIQIVSSSLADSLARTEIESECVCKLKYGLFAEEECKMQSVTVVSAGKQKPSGPKG